VARVDLLREHLKITLKNNEEDVADARPVSCFDAITIEWTKPPSKRRREILIPDSPSNPLGNRPIRADARARLVAAIARGRLWLSELTTTNGATPHRIAARENCSVRKVNMTVSLAFLAPTLVKAAIEGRLPRGIGVARLCDLPAEWSLQHRKLGLSAGH
jgi:site-specific DNA recombinase